MTYVFSWGNNPRRAQLKGRFCEVLASGRMGTVLVRFFDTGECVTTSYRALRETYYREPPVVRVPTPQLDLFRSPVSSDDNTRKETT